jgi:hypothetical protein
MSDTKPATMNDQQFAVVAIAMNTLKKEAQRALQKLPPLTLAILIFLCAAGVEVAIAYGVFSGLLKGVEDPVVQHSAGLLSMTAIIAMLTYHWISKDNPNSWSVRLIRNLSTIFAPFYVLAGGLFLGILLFPGAIATATTGTPDTIFGLPVEEVSAESVGQSIVTWLQDNLVLAAPLFIAGVMGISVMGLFVGGQCIDTISTNTRIIFRALSNYKIAKRAWTQALADDKASRKVANEHAQLKKRNDNVIRTQAAVLAAGQVNQFVQRAEAAIDANPALFTAVNDEPSSAVGHLFGKQPDLSGIKTRINTLKTHNVAYIRRVIDRILK